MESLYTISEKFLEAIEQMKFDENTGEVIDCSALDGVEAEFAEKAENLACYIKDCRSLAIALKIEEVQLEKRRADCERQIKRMKTYLDICMRNAGQSKFESAKCKISFRKSSAVNVVNIEDLDIDYITTKETRTADKKAIKEAILAGNDVKGATLTETQNLQIK